MPNYLRFAFIFCLFTYGIHAQEKFTLSGTLTDEKNNETLIGVNILVKGTKSFAVTNEYGFYSLTLPVATYDIEFSYLGYETQVQKIDLTQNQKLNIQLKEKGELLDEVVVTSNESKSNIRKPEISVNKLTTATIKQMPVVLGEVDIIIS